MDWGIARAGSMSEGVVLVVPADSDVTEYPGCDLVVTGGPTRSESVRAGLAQVPGDVDYVLVHDVARPLASKAVFERVIEALAGDCDGAVPGIAVSDTLKRSVAHESGFLSVSTTLDREGVYAIQTPQGFKAAVLRAAHATGKDATDDAHLVELAGGHVVIVPGDPRNIKVTTPSDIVICESLLEREV